VIVETLANCQIVLHKVRCFDEKPAFAVVRASNKKLFSGKPLPFFRLWRVALAT
jgi:hypothetical protein